MPVHFLFIIVHIYILTVIFFVHGSLNNYCIMLDLSFPWQKINKQTNKKTQERGKKRGENTAPPPPLWNYQNVYFDNMLSKGFVSILSKQHYEDVSETNDKMATHTVSVTKWETTQQQGNMMVALLNTPIVYDCVEK